MCRRDVVNMVDLYINNAGDMEDTHMGSYKTLTLRAKTTLLTKRTDRYLHFLQNRFDGKLQVYKASGSLYLHPIIFESCGSNRL